MCGEERAGDEDGAGGSDGWRRTMVLHVEEHPGTGLVAVTSPDVPGLMAVEPTLAEALASVPGIVEGLRAAARPAGGAVPA